MGRRKERPGTDRKPRQHALSSFRVLHARLGSEMQGTKLNESGIASAEGLDTLLTLAILQWK